MTSAASPTYPPTLTIVQYPHPVLRKRAEPITVFDDHLRDFCQRMFTCMDEANGIGLAAPQVGVSKRIFITDYVADPDARADGASDRRIWINPRIEAPSGHTVYEEGCLSFPGMYAKVERPSRLNFIFQNEWGAEQRITLDAESGDFLAIVVQHELDHLDGKVFVDYLSDAQLLLIRKRLKEMEKHFKQTTGKPGVVLRR
jgi:peptide deformylase